MSRWQSESEAYEEDEFEAPREEEELEEHVPELPVYAVTAKRQLSKEHAAPAKPGLPPVSKGYTPKAGFSNVKPKEKRD